MKKTRKAFTLVELLVVIAILAVLATVGIDGYTSFTKKAKESNDRGVVSQINLALQASETTNGKPKTMHEALMVVSDSGFDVTKLTPDTDGYDYVYDMDANRFALMNGTTVVAEASDRSFDTSSETKVNKWVIAHKPAEIGKNGYSTYLAKDYAGSDTQTVTTGLDCGDSDVITTINYQGSSSGQTVVIRSNGGTLNINAANDTVKHYGDGEVLVITAIASASYHENGSFPKASIAQGRIVVEETGNIPSIEITAVPTAQAPVKVETNKDVVVSATPEVVSALGDAKLENVEVKVTTTEATVVVDEKINSTDVTINGAAASPEQLLSIKKVSSLSELLTALSNKDKYIMFSNDIATNGSDLINITYSTTIDGNGHKLTGNGGNRGSVKQMMCFGWEAPELIDKIIVKDLTVETTTVTRPLECRGNTKEIMFDGVTLNATGSGNDQGFTFGGNYSDLMKLTLKKCNFAVGGDGYTFIFFNAVDMVIEDSTIAGWAGLYFKSPSSSHGARDSKVYISNSNFICHNVNWGATNAFGAIVFEDGNIDVTLVDSSLDVTSESDQEQCAILFNTEWATYFGTNLKNGHVVIKGNSSINGTIDTTVLTYDLTNDIKIEGGIFTSDPSDYLAEGHTVSRSGSLYVVK